MPTRALTAAYALVHVRRKPSAWSERISKIKYQNAKLRNSLPQSGNSAILIFDTPQRTPLAYLIFALS
jgi:hypothetical protein